MPELLKSHRMLAGPVSGEQLYAFVKRLFPLYRSITGAGLRATLDIIGEHIPLQRFALPTGRQVFDWQIPREWSIRDAWIKDASGRRVVDFRDNNLHVVAYSTPVKRSMSLDELQAHLHSLPDKPDWIPYRASYYNESWGFCLTQHQREQLCDPQYEVCIDSTLQDGVLDYGECLIKGRVEREIVFFAHCCHPSLANDNLSGIAIATFLAQWLGSQQPYYSYRFIFAPSTIGSIAWLSENRQRLDRIAGGLILSVIGDAGKLHYKLSRHENATIDRVVQYVLKQSGRPFEVLPFEPYGYDERQFCSPGINLPVGRLTRTPNGCYAEYHTSGDNLDFVNADALAGSLETCRSIVEALEQNRVYRNLSPMCEPQLGRRGLYSKAGGYLDMSGLQYALLWVLNYSDGQHRLLDIAGKSGLPLSLLADAAELLEQADLLKNDGDVK